MVEFNTILVLVVLVVAVFLAFRIGQRIGEAKKQREWERNLPMHRKEAILKSRAVLGGHFSENLAPYLPDFPYLPTECRFVGEPVDFIVFKGMDEKKIDEVVFVEVKSGNSRLSPQEKNLKEAIDNGRVSFEEYRIPKELTGKNGIDEKIEDLARDYMFFRT
jgi:predicted Holliday junction resolvase-like endonuclease